MNLVRAAETLVRDLMSTDIVTVAPGTSLHDALERMVAANVGSLVVTRRPSGQPLRRGDVVGMVPVFFALRESIRGGGSVDAAMFTELITAGADERIGDVLGRIVDNRTWRLIVVDGDAVLGLVSATDIVRLFASSVRKDLSMQIGVDTSFYKIDIRWSGRTAMFRRGDEYVADVHDVVDISVERREVRESDQVVMLLRLHCADGSVRALFLDSDPVQSNVREVASHLDRLDDVFSWLLEPGYAHRQGDVGIYAAPDIPSASRRVPAAEVPEVFAPILSKRHSLTPVEACEFFAGQDTWFVHVRDAARLVHPEHQAIAISPGLYEIRGARGIPLPSFVGLRGEEREALGE
ncbi:MAG: CBS domain-containing protein [Thermoanaerobaculia bacterium]